MAVITCQKDVIKFNQRADSNIWPADETRKLVSANKKKEYTFI